MLAQARAFSAFARRTSDRCASCSAPIVGTKPVSPAPPGAPLRDQLRNAFDDLHAS